jgi:hypothetical protein
VALEDVVARRGGDPVVSTGVWLRELQWGFPAEG